MPRHTNGKRKLTFQQTTSRPAFPPYLIAHACFHCRKSFKKMPKVSHTCPECGRQLYSMGCSFKAPKQRDIEQWHKVQALYAYGFRFFSYRSFNCAPLPERFREVKDFVRHNPNHPFRIAEPDLSLLHFVK